METQNGVFGSKMREEKDMSPTITATAKFNSTAKQTKSTSIYNHRESDLHYLQVFSAFGLGGGLLAFLCGMISIVFYAVLSHPDERLNFIGTGLLLASAPMLMLGSYFMDKFDAKEKEFRQARVEATLRK